jgi:thioredoxin 1
MTMRTTGTWGLGPVVAAALLLILSAGCNRTEAQPRESKASAVASRTVQSLPKLVDVGAGRCIPCKAMAPILEDLRTQYAGKLEVLFVDVWKDPEAGRPYQIRMIPTQIFYGKDGRELARHEGFMSKAQILAQWKAVGVEL